MNRLVLLLLLGLILPISQHVFATVVVGGNVTCGTSSSIISVIGTSSPVTLNTLNCGPTGMTAQNGASDPLYTYQFSSVSNPSPKVQLTAVSSTEADFTLLTSSLTDLQGTALGIALSAVQVNGANVVNSFAANVNSFTIGAGTAVKEFFTGGVIPPTPSPSPGGGGGGAGAPVNQLVQQVTSVTTPQGVTFTANSDVFSLSQIKNETLTITWPSNETLTVNSIQFGASTLQIHLPVQPPFAFNGDPYGNSKAVIVYVVQTPPVFCSDQVTANCINPNNSNIIIPISFDVSLNGVEITQQITTQFNIIGAQSITTFTAISLVAFIFAAAFVFKYLKGRKGSKKHESKIKSHKKDKKPMKLKKPKKEEHLRVKSKHNKEMFLKKK